jgi:hypothetical protein
VLVVGLIYVGEDMVQLRTIVNTAEHNETTDFTKDGEFIDRRTSL